MIDAGNWTTTITYDQYAAPLMITAPDGLATAITYDDAGQEALGESEHLLNDVMPDHGWSHLDEFP